jgi:hypothetical protein
MNPPSASNHTRRWLLLFLALISVFVLSALSVRSPREPSWEGKTLSAWIVSGAEDTNAQAQAYQAIQGMGATATPCLLHWIEARPSKVRRWFNEFLDDHSSTDFEFEDHSYELNQLSLAGFAYAGESARLAIPKLEALLEDVDIGYDAFVALTYIGEPAVPAVLSALDHKSKPVRTMAIGVLANVELRQHPRLINKLLELTSDPDTNIKDAAVRGLRDATGHPDVGQVLANIARDRTHPGRLNAQHYLHQWSTNVALTLPVFEAGARDADVAIRRCAIGGLAQIRARPMVDLMEPWLGDPDNTVRAIAVASLGRATNQIDEAKVRLERALIDPDRVVRAAAAGALSLLRARGEGRPVETFFSSAEMIQIKSATRPADLQTLWRIDEEVARAVGFTNEPSPWLPVHGTSYMPDIVLRERFSKLKRLSVSSAQQLGK